MKGHLRERSPGHWAVVLEIRDPESGRRKRKWHTFHGTKRQAQSECARFIAALQADAASRVDEALQQALEKHRGPAKG
jgi:hypothetical protein